MEGREAKLAGFRFRHGVEQLVVTAEEPPPSSPLHWVPMPPIFFGALILTLSAPTLTTPPAIVLARRPVADFDFLAPPIFFAKRCGESLGWEFADSKRVSAHVPLERVSSAKAVQPGEIESCENSISSTRPTLSHSSPGHPPHKEVSGVGRTRLGHFIFGSRSRNPPAGHDPTLPAYFQRGTDPPQQILLLSRRKVSRRLVTFNRPCSRPPITAPPIHRSNNQCPYCLSHSGLRTIPGRVFVDA